MQNKTFTFIGGGNMATAIIVGLIQHNIPASSITVIDPNQAKLDSLKNTHNINGFTAADNILTSPDYLFICVKPQIMQSVCTELRPALSMSRADTVLISVAAGITLRQLRDWLAYDKTLVRCMPNTPALLGLGATGLFSDTSLTSQQTEELTAIFNSIGISVWLASEQDINAVTALSGSGPAYFFRLFEILQTLGVELGLSQEDANALILQTALGAARMAQTSSLPLDKLRENVTSKGGTTAAALESLDHNHLSDVISQAVHAAHQRSIELAK